MKKILPFFALLMLSVLTMGVVCAKQNIDRNADIYIEVHAFHIPVSYTNLIAHETERHIVGRFLFAKNKAIILL